MRGSILYGTDLRVCVSTDRTEIISLRILRILLVSLREPALCAALRRKGPSVEVSCPHSSLYLSRLRREELEASCSSQSTRRPRARPLGARSRTRVRVHHGGRRRRGAGGEEGHRRHTRRRCTASAARLLSGLGTHAPYAARRTCCMSGACQTRGRRHAHHRRRVRRLCRHGRQRAPPLAVHRQTRHRNRRAR